MESRISRISIVVLIVGGICWLGGINVRGLIGSNLLQPWSIEFQPNIHPYVERTVFSLIAQSSLVVCCSYVAVGIAGIVFLKTTSLRLKEQGWLMMSAILFYLFTPVEIYTGILDLKMWLLDAHGSNDLVEFRKLFIHRLAALGGVPHIALAGYYTILGLCVFRPMIRIKQSSIE